MTSLAAAVLAASCNGSGADDGRYATTVDALCQARDAADTAAAEVAFYAGAHDDLHELANEVIEVDRSAAASMLTSKNRVEGALTEQRPIGEVVAAVDALLADVQASLATIDHPVPGC